MADTTTTQTAQTAAASSTAARSTISAASVRQHLQQNEPLSILDVRTPGEFAAAHIPGALNIPLDQLREYARQLTSAGPDLVLVCQSGVRAHTAGQLLRSAGAAGPRVLDGGMGTWTLAGGPVESGQGRWPLERQVRLVAGSLVLTGIVGSLVWPPARFLSGAIGGGLTFAAVTNTCAMADMLAKLPYNRGRKQDVERAVAQLST